jgi:phage tail sheath gpL-like
MAVPFKQIPSNLRVPLFYAELDPSLANTAQINQRTLIIGQITAAGAATPNVPMRSQSVADAKAQGGPGSMLALMTAAYRQNDPLGEVWYLPLADAGGAVASAGAVAFTGPSTAAGTLYLYLAASLVAINIASGQTAAQIATAVAAAINAAPDLPVTAAVDGVVTSKVNITARNLGAAGNDIDIRVNYRGTASGEVTPAGVTVTITAMTGGATNPVLTTALANLTDEAFDFIITPYTDATSLAALTALLNDTTGRWSYATQVYGHVFMAYRGSYATLGTFGAGLNDPHLSCMGVFDVPTPVWVWSAAMAGAAAVSLRNDPGLPLQTVQIQGVFPPPMSSRFSLAQRNALLFDGISTFRADASGAVTIENMITTYQHTALGQPDNSYLQVETMFLLAYIFRRLRRVVETKYARKKLAKNGTRFAPGLNIVTPNVIRADQIAEYQAMENEGYVQDSRGFAAGLIVEQDPNNPSRINELWDGVLIGGLRIFALLGQFRLS